MVKLTNNDNLPQYLVRAFAYQSLQHDAKADYSVTQLLDPARAVALVREHSDLLTDDISERSWALLGSAAHVVLESGKGLEELMEQKKLEGKDIGAVEEIVTDDPIIYEHRIFGEIDGITFSGQPDAYAVAEKTIYDFKTASCWEFVYEGGRPREDREQQLNLYAYLGRKYEGWEVENIAAVFLFRDWGKAAAQRNDKFPDKNMLVYPFRMWSDEEAETFLRERISAHEQAKTNLPYCTPEEQKRDPDKYAVRKRGVERAVKLADSRTEALNYIASKNIRNAYIEERPGKVARCENFCLASTVCDQFTAYNALKDMQRHSN